MHTKRYERTEMLLGADAVAKLRSARVAVFGAGGVGGYTIEALARSGVRAITVIDGDTISESNLNRQIFASCSTLGQPKPEAARSRIRDIAPECTVEAVYEYYTPEKAFPFGDYDYVIDAIDTVSAKLAIAKRCFDGGVPVISAMGAGNKLDPTRFEVSDIYRTSVCPLAAAMRRELRKMGVAKLKVVYSREPALTPLFQPEGEPESRRLTPSSWMICPAACGLVIAGEVIRDLTQISLTGSGRE